METTNEKTPPPAPATTDESAAKPADEAAPAQAAAPAAPSPALPGPWRWRFASLLLLAVLGWLALTGMNLWMGELNQDEGWYLYAARQLRENGQIPYRDFAFTQPPMLPLVYATAYGWVQRWGLLGARFLTAGFGLLSVLAAGWLAMRTGPKKAQRMSLGLCAALVGLNVYQSYFTTVVKTYALAAAFLTWGLVCLSTVRQRHAARASFVAGFLLACAAATRVSLAPACVLGWFYLLAMAHKVRRWAWFDYALGAALAASLFVVPFYLMGRDGFMFGLVEYHTLREAGPLAARLAYKAGTLIRLLQAYFPAVVAAIAFLGLSAWEWKKRRTQPAAPEKSAAYADAAKTSAPPAFGAFLWLVAGAIFLLHLSASFPYDDYQVPVYPVFCAALAAAITRRWVLREEAARERLPEANTPVATTSRRFAALGCILLFSLLYVAASPLTQAWFVAGRDRVWWNLRSQSPVTQLRDAADYIRDMTAAAGGTALLTQDAYLAVEADLDLLPGLEMGPFSYYPDWPDARAANLHVHNRDTLKDAILALTNAPVAALSGYSFAIRCPDVQPIARDDAELFQKLIADRYDWVEDIPHFGQASTTLALWRIKTAGLPPEEAALVAAQSDAAARRDAAPPSAPDDAPVEDLEPVVDATLSDGPDTPAAAEEFTPPAQRKKGK